MTHRNTLNARVVSIGCHPAWMPAVLDRPCFIIEELNLLGFYSNQEAAAVKLTSVVMG